MRIFSSMSTLALLFLTPDALETGCKMSLHIKLMRFLLFIKYYSALSKTLHTLHTHTVVYLSSSFSEATQSFGCRTDCITELGQVAVLCVVWDAGHGLAQDLHMKHRRVSRSSCKPLKEFGALKGQTGSKSGTFEFSMTLSIQSKYPMSFTASVGFSSMPRTV